MAGTTPTQTPLPLQASVERRGIRERKAGDGPVDLDVGQAVVFVFDDLSLRLLVFV